MKRHRIFWLMSAWPQLNFVAVKVIRVPAVTAGHSAVDIYLTDNKEQPCHLFVCQVPDNEVEMWVARLSCWMKEYAVQLSVTSKETTVKTPEKASDIHIHPVPKSDHCIGSINF